MLALALVFALGVLVGRYRGAPVYTGSESLFERLQRERVRDERVRWTL